MKTLNKILGIAMTGLLSMGMASCVDGNDWDTDDSHSRLFSIEADKITVETEDVSATVTFKTMQGVEHYIIEVSTDPLDDDTPMGGENAIVYGEDGSITKSPVVLEGLAGDTPYYLRIKGTAEGMRDSKWSYYKDGETFKTKAEQIFLDPVASDRAESSLHVAWTHTPNVTNLVVQDGEGNELQNIELDAATIEAAEYTITGLVPSTNYTIIIMNGEAKRGTLNMSTTAAMPAGDYKTELPATITRISGDLLNSIVEDAKAATGKETNIAITIGLRPDMTYDVASISETDGTDANLAIPDGIAITFFGLSGGEAPTMKMLKSVDLAGSHAYVRFENVNITDGGCQYFINQSTNSSLGELSFKQCTFSNFERSLIRTQGSGAISIDNFIIDDCVLTNMSTGDGYSVIYFGTNTTNIGKVDIKNSTFDTSKKSFIEASKAPVTNGIFITNCTFYNNVASGKYFIDANGQNTNLTMTNTILGKTLHESSSRGARTKGTMVFDNCLRASDCVYGSNDIKELPAGDLSSADIFKDPDKHDFTLKINKLIGDPRWFPTE